MAEKKVIEIEVNTKGAVKSMDALEKATNDVSKSFADVYGDLQPLTARMGEAEDRLYELANAGKTTSQEYKDLLKSVGDFRKVQISTDMAVDAAATTMGQKLGGALGGVSSGFTAVSGVMGAFGTQSEEVEKALLKVQSAMAIQQGIQGIKESVSSFRELGAVIKATSVFQGIYNFITTGSFKAIASNTAAKVADTKATVAQGTATVATTTAIGGATVATKLLRAALITSGIGALVVLLGMAADAMGMFSGGAEDAEASQKKLDAALEKTNLTIERQKTLYDETKGIIDKQTKRDIINATNAGASEKELLKIKTDGAKQAIDLYKKQEREASNLYIKMSKSGSTKQFEAAEKAWKEASNKLTDAQLDFDYEEAERNKKKTVNKKENNKVEVDLEKEKADRIKALNDNLLAYYDAIEQNRQSKITGDKEKEQQELANKYEALYLLADKAGQSTKDLQEQQGKDSQAITKKYDDLDKVAKDEKEKLEKERVAKAKEEIAKEKAILQELTLSEEELKLAKLTAQYEADQLLYKDNKEILKALDEKYAKDKEVLDNEETEKKKATLQKQLDLVKGSFQAFADVATLFAGKNKKAQKTAFNIQKGANIAQTTIDTFTAAMAAYKSAVGIPYVGPILAPIAAAGAVAVGVMNIKKIAASKFEGGGTPSGGDGGGGGGGATAPTMSAPQFNVVGQSGVNQLASLNQQPIQAYVVSGQVTSQQALDRNRLANATLGG